MMKVAHLFITLPVGGAEDLVLSIVRNSPGAEIVCLRDLGVAGEQARDEGLPVTLLPWLKSKRFSPWVVWKLSRWLRAERFDVVHTQVYNAHVYGVLAAWLAGIPSVMHHQKTFNRERPRRWWTMRQLAKVAAQQITLSEKSKGDITDALRVKESEVTVVPNFVDPKVFCPPQDRAAIRASLGLSPDDRIVGGIASLNTQKNHAMTIRMMALLAERMPGLQCLILGEGRLRSELQAQIDELGLTDRVKLVGNQRPIVPWLQSLDTMLLPSTWEGQPLVILQALACQVPVVSSRIEGNVAALGEEDVGLFELDDDEGYAGRVHKSLAESDFRQQLIDQQKQAFEAQPSFSSLIEQLEKLYEQLKAAQ
jgi:glycosyltransferase involved in cell wall biosynthesis